MNTIAQDNLSRLQWACRRGMLELDVLLGNFLKGAWSQLDLQNKQRFTDLLSCTDPELFTWLLGQETPADADLAIITDLIRQHAKSGF